MNEFSDTTENINKENDDGKEHNILQEEFVFKDEIYRLIEEEKNKCIRSILWTAEIILKDKKSDDFIKLRKSVLDSVNDLYRRVFSTTNRMI